MKNFNKKRKGAVAFEFIIVLFFFCGAVFFAANLLSPTFAARTEAIGTYVSGCDEGVKQSESIGSDYYTKHTQSRYCPRTIG